MYQQGRKYDQALNIELWTQLLRKSKGKITITYKKRSEDAEEEPYKEPKTAPSHSQMSQSPSLACQKDAASRYLLSHRKPLSFPGNVSGSDRWNLDPHACVIYHVRQRQGILCDSFWTGRWHGLDPCQTENTTQWGTREAGIWMSPGDDWVASYHGVNENEGLCGFCWKMANTDLLSKMSWFVRKTLPSDLICCAGCWTCVNLQRAPDVHRKQLF